MVEMVWNEWECVGMVDTGREWVGNGWELWRRGRKLSGFSRQGTS